jgi:3-hydroxyisobutyrate dehydrogenase-like beta-hydroxyacid dehydrogenase
MFSEVRRLRSERIGWIGLGKLGYPMAINLLESGYRLSVYNRTRSKAEPLAERGAQVASDPLQVVETGGIVVSVLWDSEATESLVTPAFLVRMEGGIHIGMCTGSPEAAKRLAKLHTDHGSTYVEAPVFGRPDAVMARQLAIPYVGPFEGKIRVKPVLTALGGSALFDMGEQPGVPTVIKQLGNFLIISAGRSLLEGLAIAQSAGVDAAAAVKMLTETLFPSPIYRNYGKAIAEKTNVINTSPIPAKDLGLFSQLAEEHALPHPITQTLLQLTNSTNE